MLPLDAPVEVSPGPPPTDLIGTYPGAQSAPCVGEAREEEACVPGGVSWMGSPRLDVLDAREVDGTTERVVVLSPFFVDRAEVTVTEMRAARVARVVDDPVEAGTSIPGCLYTPSPGPNSRSRLMLGRNMQRSWSESAIAWICSSCSAIHFARGRSSSVSAAAPSTSCRIKPRLCIEAIVPPRYSPERIRCET